MIRFLAQWRLMILLMALFAPSAPALATEQVVLGPVQYTRTPGLPNQFTQDFTLPPTLIAPFRLHAQNGNPNGTQRINSATITLNGVQVAGLSNFSEQVAAFDRTVALQAPRTR